MQETKQNTNELVEQIVKNFSVDSMSGYAGKEDWQEGLRYSLTNLIQTVEENERERIFNETAELRIMYGKKENMTAYKLVNNTIKEIWLVLGAKQNKRGDFELLKSLKETNHE